MATSNFYLMHTTLSSNGILQAAGMESLLQDHPHPDADKDMLIDLHHQSFQKYRGDPGRGQPSTGSSLSNSHHWSDCTLTGSVSGQCSLHSWGMDEAVRFSV